MIQFIRKNDKMNDNLFKKFFEFGFGNIVVLFIGLLTTPFITRIISPEQFGKSSMFNTVTNIFSVIILMGLDQAFVRYFYEEKREKRPKLLIKCMVIPLIFACILGLIILFFYEYTSILIIGENSFTICVVLIFQNILLMLNRFSLLVIRMQQKAKKYSFIQIISKISYLLSILLLFNFFGDNYRTLIYAIVICNLVTVLIAFYVEKNFWKIAIKSREKSTIEQKELIKFGYPLLFTLIINWLFESIDKIFINSYQGYNELGLYSSAFSIIALINAVQTSFNTFWSPVSYENYKKNPENKLFFENVYIIVSYMMCILAILIILFKDILIFLLGKKYLGASFIVPFLIFIPIMNTISEITVIGINFSKKTKYHGYIALICAMVNVFGNFILVPKLGAIGAAISTGFSYFIFYLLRTLFSKKFYDVRYRNKTFLIVILLIYLFALYASFNKLNYIYILFGVICLIITTILYFKPLMKIISRKE